MINILARVCECVCVSIHVGSNRNKNQTKTLLCFLQTISGQVKSNCNNKERHKNANKGEKKRKVVLFKVVFIKLK